MREKKKRENFQMRSRQQVKDDIAAQSKVCGACKERKPFEQYVRYRKATDGRFSQCKACCLETEHQEKVKAARRDSHLKTRYGITSAEFDVMLEEQKGCCAICKADDPAPARKGTYSFAVDHDHQTQEVRGLLCNNCNKGLGNFQDNHELLIKAARYLYFKEIQK